MRTPLALSSIALAAALASTTVSAQSFAVRAGYANVNPKSDNGLIAGAYLARAGKTVLVLERRDEVVAARITDYLKATNRYDKTIVFCEDIDHAERMRQALTNLNPERVTENRKYVMRITGNDKEGQDQLGNFIDPEATYPVLVTTSRLLSTGVDAQTCRLIVLDREVGSMTEFKQIVGRGTRIREAEGKLYFTIMDFRKATNLFADPDFDGEPVQIYEPGIEESPVPPESEETEESEEFEGVKDIDRPGLDTPPPDIGIDEGDPDAEPRKYYVNDVSVTVINERVQYFGADGRLITESLKDYTRKNIDQSFGSLDAFIQRWTTVEKKEVLLAELAEQGILLEALREEVGKELDDFDLICHVAFDQPPLTRKERAEQVRKRNYFAKYGEKAQAVLNALLDKYEEEGITTIEQGSVLKVQPLNLLGSPVELVRAFGKGKDFEEAIKELEKEIYKSA
jgi:type I restriction enzyme R subunit